MRAILLMGNGFLITMVIILAMIGADGAGALWVLFFYGAALIIGPLIALFLAMVSIICLYNNRYIIGMVSGCLAVLMGTPLIYTIVSMYL